MSTNGSGSAGSSPAGFRITAEMLRVLGYLAEAGPCDRARIVSVLVAAGRLRHSAYRTVHGLERKRLIEHLAPNVTSAYQITELGKTILAMAAEEQ